MIAGIAVWIAWDVVVASNKTPGDTISEITLFLARLAPIIPLAVGVVCGHLFGAFDGLAPAIIWIRAHPLLPFVWGVLSGLLFWSQVKIP